jgi:hypothetical protein
MAIAGRTTGKMAQHYTCAADRKRLAQDAAQLFLPAQEEKNAPTLVRVREPNEDAKPIQVVNFQMVPRGGASFLITGCFCYPFHTIRPTRYQSPYQQVRGPTASI